MTPTATLDQAHPTYRETAVTVSSGYASLSDIRSEIWAQKLRQQLEHLLSLPEGWDSYGAKPVSRWAAWEALRFLHVAPRVTPPPAVVPVNDGSLQLEWHRQQIDLELRFGADGRTSAWFGDLRTGEDWEREAWSSLSEIQRALHRLADNPTG